MKARVGFCGTPATSRPLRRWQYGRVPRENRHDAIDAAPEWSLLMLFEQRDDFFFILIRIFRIRQGRVAVFVLAVDISSSAIR